MAAKPLWYISFATDEGFRGATVVEGASAEDALTEATGRGLNPGGQAAILPVPEPTPPDAARYLNRLVGKEELIADGGRRHGDLPPDMQHKIAHAGEFVCASCN